MTHRVTLGIHRTIRELALLPKGEIKRANHT